MSPKKITNLAVIVAVISILGTIGMLLAAPDWGPFNWWPAASLGLSLLLIIIALIRGIILAAQKRIDMVDAMNDCNAGILKPEDF